MSQPAERLTPDERVYLTRMIVHVQTCRACTKANGIHPTIRGCPTGHLLAVRAAGILARFFPPPAPPAPPAQGAMF